MTIELSPSADWLVRLLGLLEPLDSLTLEKVVLFSKLTGRIRMDSNDRTSFDLVREAAKGNQAPQVLSGVQFATQEDSDAWRTAEVLRKELTKTSGAFDGSTSRPMSESAPITDEVDQDLLFRLRSTAREASLVRRTARADGPVSSDSGGLDLLQVLASLQKVNVELDSIEDIVVEHIPAPQQGRRILNFVRKLQDQTEQCLDAALHVQDVAYLLSGEGVPPSLGEGEAESAKARILFTREIRYARAVLHARLQRLASAADSNELL